MCRISSQYDSVVLARTVKNLINPARQDYESVELTILFNKASIIMHTYFRSTALCDENFDPTMGIVSPDVGDHALMPVLAKE